MTVISRDKKWWKEAIIYQIYPASFCDSNGDGVGDFQGIISKLDYIKALGADVIWICPMYDSPQVDMGYDISNYEDVYAPYGTLADMEQLIKEAHARDIKVMLDLVINHTSDQHAWFKESRSSKENPKRDWYIWKPARYSESGERLPPNNWRSNFGMDSAWQWDEATQEYYLHLFAVEQPDLNWENPETRKAIYEASMEFWLQRGVDGFRVDTVNMYSKPQDYPDAPIVDPSTFAQPAHMHYCNGPRMHEFLGEMNVILTKYNAITVGELPATPDTAKVLKYVSAEAKQLDMVFQFDVVDLGHGTTHAFDATPPNYTLPDLKDAVDRMQRVVRGTDAWITVFLENHDQGRSITRFAHDAPEHRVASGKLLSLMQAALTGTQYIYQGQEIGVVNVPKDGYPPENYLDLNSIFYYNAKKERYGADNKEEMDKAFTAIQYFARDHSRVPICWNGTGKYGGFSEAAEKAGKEVAESWMKPHPYAAEINVASQLDDPTSVLAFYKKAIQFRKDHANVTVYADYRTLRHDDPNVYTFVKETPNGVATAFVTLNFSTEQQQYEAPSAAELGLPEGAEPKLVEGLSTHSGKSAPGILAPLEGKIYLVNL